MTDIYQESIEAHRKIGGKLEIKSKMSLKTKRDLSIAYTPGVAGVSDAVHKNPELAKELTIKKNMVAVVSDGSAVLGLGNIGAEAALPVMEGKAVLFKEFAGVDAFPICLDTQEVEEIIKTVKLIAPTFGGINLEDISAPRCFEIEERLQKELNIPVMHDDQHGTAIVVLAGMINALKLRESKKEEVKIMINGVGAAGVAITKILLSYGIEDIILCDSRGIIFEGRDNLNPVKESLALITNKNKLQGNLAEAVKGRDIFIGVSVADVLSQEMVKSMNEKPIIFAMANPQPEIMPEDAISAGAFIVATGRSDFPNQVNNVLAFPGLFRGALDKGIDQFSSEMFVKAAEAIASCVEDLSVDKIIPDPFDERVAKAVAVVVR
ncbi:MAG: NADP-dependent malic enzyme [Candidatus Moranbacteria bacterium]|nr:NADP-dependent malic enzyme [Candidatus Moranbacteria bacterium]